MAQKVINKALGIRSYKNELNQPAGSLEIANNVIIDRDNIIQSRRGFSEFNSFGLDEDTKVRQLLEYRDSLLCHYEDDSGNQRIAFEKSDGTFEDFDGEYHWVEDGLRIKGSRIQGNMYFTTSNGVKKMSATSNSEFNSNPDYIIDSGIVKPLDIESSTLINNDLGFFQAGYYTKYRYIWNYVDTNDNLIISEPSEKVLIQNIFTSTDDMSVEHKIRIPDSIKVGYYLQLYRTESEETPDNLGEEYYQTYEYYITNDDITLGYVEILDTLSDSARTGELPLYTNANDGDGAASIKQAPPKCKDIETYQDYTFYANTEGIYNQDITTLSVEGIEPGVTTLTITDDVTTEDYIFGGQRQENRLDFTSYIGLTPIQASYLLNLSAWSVGTLSGRGLYLYTPEGLYLVWYKSESSQTYPLEINPDTIKVIEIDLDLIDTTATPDEIAQHTYSTIVNSFDDNLTATYIAASNEVTFLNKEAGEVDEPESTTIPIDLGNFTQGQKYASNLDGSYFTFEVYSGLGILGWFDSTGIADAPIQPALVVRINTRDITTKEELLDQIATSISEGGTNEGFGIHIDGDEFVSLYPLNNNTLELFENTTPVNLPAEVVRSTYQTGIPASAGAIEISPYVGFNPIKANEDTTVNIINTINNDSTLVYGSYLTYGAEFAKFNLYDRGNSSTAFKLQINGGTDVNDNFSPIIPSTPDYLVFEKESNPNRVFYSQLRIPEAVTPASWFDVGTKDEEILRIIALRDSLFIFKTDSIWRLSGTSSANFSLTLMDSSAPLIAADTATVLNNRIYALTAQGVTMITDGGVSIISREVEDNILTPTNKNLYPEFNKQAFAVSYEGDRSYLLWLPTKQEDEVATQCFRYNVFTNSWVRWEISARCGKIKNTDDKLYLGSGDDNFVLQERKNLTREDYADRDFAIDLNLGNLDGTTVDLNPDNIVKGDVLYQRQYATVTRYNRLINKLILEPAFVQDYESLLITDTYKAPDIDALLVNLNIFLLVDDPTTAYSYTSSSDLYTIGVGFNQIISDLDASLLPVKSGYNPYVDTDGNPSCSDYENVVASIDKFTGSFSITTETPFVKGEVTVYKAIPCDMYWVQDGLGDNSTQKHIREASLMFDQFNFNQGEMQFKTDISEAGESVEFQGEGNGALGSQVYGEAVFGGVANQRPFHTYIPRNEQRCRTMSIGFNHTVARENFSLIGYSLTYNNMSSPRSYRR